MRRSPLAVVLSLFLGGAILATFAIATTAFATMDKSVRVVVDGQSQTVHTFAGDVAGVLGKAGITLGPHDTVAPDLTAPVGDGSQVVVDRGRLLRLELDGHAHDLWVTSRSVEDALSELGLSEPGTWLSVARSTPIPQSGLSLAVRVPQHVSVLVDGMRKVRQTTAPTVGVLLAQLHVKLRKLDKVNVSLTRYPTDGLVVTIDRISQGTVVQNLAIPYRTKYVHTSALYVGQSRVSHYGQPGLRVETFRLTWKNHKLVHRHLVHMAVRSRPATQIVEVGTTPRPQYTPANDGLNWAALANCESGGNPRSVSSDGRYRGLYQFTMGTWESVGGSGDPINASSNEQTYRAQLLYKRSGDSAWPVCGHDLYS